MGRVEAEGVGSIPACAGEPPSAVPFPSRARVYPRVCGGTGSKPDPEDTIPGLSPRVRGNLTGMCSESLWRRSIPACAGEPSFRVASSGRSRVYPRVCGGTNVGSHTGTSVIGLSPRVRGNPNGAIVGGLGLGSIPACAGEPAVAIDPSGFGGVYPRVCGGTGGPQRRGLVVEGLSPRVRGNRERRTRRRGA